MNRSDFLNFESSAGPARRSSFAPLELRAEGDVVTFRGYASTTETEYDVYGGTFPGWVETIARGAFKKTLAERADVSFLINHEGMALARTTAGTLKLSEDGTGLLAEARMNRNVSAVNDLYELSQDGNMTEMSFGFRVTRDAWTTDDGEKADSSTGSNRRILEVNMNRGDVSSVNYGANPTTSGGFRALALAELRDGRLDPTVLERLASAVVEERAPVTGAEMQLQRIEEAVGELRAMFVVSTATDAQGTPTSWLTEAPIDEIRSPDYSEWVAPQNELLSAYIALHERLRDPAA